MYPIQNMTDSAKQKQVLALPDGSEITFLIYYVELQYGWFIDEITYGDFTLRGVRITNSPNILHQFRNQIPFGLACVTDDDREPTQQEDFLGGASKLYVLTKDECDQYTEYLSGQV